MQLVVHLDYASVTSICGGNPVILHQMWAELDALLEAQVKRHGVLANRVTEISTSFNETFKLELYNTENLIIPAADVSRINGILYEFELIVKDFVEVYLSLNYSKNDYLTSTQAAPLLNISPRQVSRLCVNNSLKAIKINEKWRISRSEINSHKKFTKMLTKC